MVFCRSCLVITVHHGDPWSWLSAGAEDWHACQDHCDRCHISEGRKGIQRGRKGGRGEGGKEGGREGGREVEWEGEGQFTKVDLLMVLVVFTGVEVD